MSIVFAVLAIWLALRAWRLVALLVVIGLACGH